MTREEALVKIGSALTLVNDVLENFTDEIGRAKIPNKELLPYTPPERLIKESSDMLTDALALLKCTDKKEYISKTLNIMLKSMMKQAGGDKDDGDPDDIKMPF